MSNEIEIPEIDSVWKHKNGNEYTVLLIANTNTERPEKYPVTVVYMNIHTGTVWSRRLSDWHRSMTLVPKLSANKLGYSDPK